MFGTIKKIIRDKGFGFIVPDDGSDDVFFHRSKLAPNVVFEDLREGDEVEFQVTKGEKGPQASTVRLLHPRRVHRAAEKSRTARHAR